MKIHITVLTVFPELSERFFETSLIKRACESGVLSYSLIRFADCIDVRERIDTPMVGHAAGMVLKSAVVAAAYERAVAAHGEGVTLFFAPDGQQLSQPVIENLYAQLRARASAGEVDNASKEYGAEMLHLILICGRYEGIDARAVARYADYVFSIGDYVLLGADVAAQVFLEAFLRLVPGIVGRLSSVEEESYSRHLLDYNAYGLPVMWEGYEVPAILRSGNHKAIAQFQDAEALRKTILTRFDWLRSSLLTTRELSEVADAIPPHYVIIMHDEVMIGKKEQKEGQTSVTTIDLHDSARSSATYGIKKVFIVTPLVDQQRVTEHFLSFWRSVEGENYNKDRFDAMALIEVVSTKEDACARIRQYEGGRAPLLIATSAQPLREKGYASCINYTEQGVVWKELRPVALCFGTGQGLTPQFLAACDFILDPVGGFSSYNHLSVRSAIAVVLDRWLSYAPIERRAVAEVGKRGYTATVVKRD